MKKHRLLSIVVLTLFCMVLTACSQPGEDEFNKGIEAQRQNDLAMAEKMFKNAIELNAGLAEAHINLGYIYLAQQKFDDAWEQTTIGLEKIKKVKKTIILGESWQDQAALAYNNLAKIVFEKALQAKKAGLIEEKKRHQEHTLSLLNQALELDPEREMTLKNLSYVQRWIEEQ
ncbi:MAG: hypothetical protein C0620_03560 [Desulfuromonas sp.]|nr:MAG: hypothetical protein C0620_03560 [Desulfuromonas sp.]